MGFTRAIILLSLMSAEVIAGDLRHLIESPKVTNWGQWGNLENCPVGTFVTGMQLKVEKAEGWKDDTGLNGIKLFCSRLGESVDDDEISHPITSAVALWGEWKSVFQCSDVSTTFNKKTTAVVGFQLKVEPPKGGHDDTSANNLRIFCIDFSHEVDDQHLMMEGDGTRWGQWTDSQLCRKGYAICGLVTQIDDGGEKGYDDTALNNVRAECCKIKLHSVESEEFTPTSTKDEATFPDPIESARDLERAILHAYIEKDLANPNKHAEDSYQPNQEPGVPTTTEYLTVGRSSHISTTEGYQEGSRGQVLKPSKQPSLLDEELKRLAELNFGHPQVATDFAITSNKSQPTDGRKMDTIDSIAAQPIVPPEVVQYIDSDMKDADSDPNPIRIKVIAGAIVQNVTGSTSIPRSIPSPAVILDSSSQETNSISDSINNELLISSGSHPVFSPSFIYVSISMASILGIFVYQ